MTFKDWRKYMGYSLNRASVETGISVPVLVRLEKGGYSPTGPGTRTMAMIYRASNGMVSIEDMCNMKYYDREYLKAYPKREKAIKDRNEYRKKWKKKESK